MKKFFIFASIFFIACSPELGYPWYNGNISEALKINQDKIIMLDFYADWWGACKRLDADTFTNTEVINFSEKSLISLKVDVDTKEGSEISTEYNIQSLPTIVFVNSSNDELDRIIGYMAPETYLKRLNEIIKGENTIDDLLDKYNSSRNASVISLLAKKYFERGKYEYANSKYLELINNYKDADSSLIDEAVFQIAMIKFYNDDISGLTEYINVNNNIDFKKTALSKLKRYYRSNADIDNELNIHARSLLMFPKDPNILNSYAWRMSELEMNLEDAIIKVNKAIVLSVNDKNKQANILDTKAEVLWKLGNSEEAVKTIDMAIQLNPDNDYFIEQKDKFLSKK